MSGAFVRDRLDRLFHGVLAVTLCGVVGAPLRASDAPPHAIRGDDAERLSELVRRRAEADEIEAQLACVLEELEIRRRHQPDDWWEVGDAERLVEMLRHAKTLSVEELEAWQAASDELDRADARAKFDEVLEAGRAKIAVSRQSFPQIGFLEPAAQTVIGGTALTTGRFDEAQRFLSESLAGFRATLEEAHPQLGITMSMLASAKSFLGRHDEAETDARRAIELLSSILSDDDMRVLEARFGFALTLVHKGDMSQAEPLLRELLARVDGGTPDPYGLRLSVLNQLVLALDARGAVAQAVGVRRELVAAHTKRYGPEHPLTLQHKAQLAIHTGVHGSHELMREVVAAAARVHGKDHVRTWEMVARYAFVLHVERRTSEAIREYRKVVAAPIDRYLPRLAPRLIHAKNNLAQALYSEGRFAEAEACVREDIEAMSRAFGRNHEHTATAQRALLGLHLAGSRFGEAIRLARRLLRHPSTHPLFDTVYRTMLAVALYATGDIDAADRELRTVAESTETAFASDSGTYRSLYFHRANHPILHACILAARGKSREAFDTLEAGLARGLLDDLLVDPTPDRVASARVRSSAEIQPAIPDDAALLVCADFSVKGTDLEDHWSFLLRREGEPVAIRMHATDDESWAGWRDVIARFRRQLEQPPHLASSEARGTRLANADSVDLDQQARELERNRVRLRQHRFAPLVPHLGATDRLPEVRRLIVIPIGDMASVPLEVLAPDYVVTYVPSGSVLGVLTSRAQRPDTLKPRLLSVVPGEDSNRRGLPGIRREAQAIASIFRRAQAASPGTTVVSTKADFVSLARKGRLERHTHLHVACHARIDTDRPLDSFLELAPSGDSDGRLTARDLLELGRTLPRHVALSACRSGEGKALNAEGILGFVRPLLRGGACQALVTRWEVDDIATSFLMTRYYANLIERGLPSGAALSEAQRWLRGLSEEDIEQLWAAPEIRAATSSVDEDNRGPYDHPYYWAGFMYLGAPAAR